MRDDARIRSITMLVRDIWSYFPDMRFFQLMMNIETYMGVGRQASNKAAIRWNCEDSTTEEALGNLLRQIEDGSGKWPG